MRTYLEFRRQSNPQRPKPDLGCRSGQTWIDGAEVAGVGTITLNTTFDTKLSHFTSLALQRALGINLRARNSLSVARNAKQFATTRTEPSREQRRQKVAAARREINWWRYAHREKVRPCAEFGATSAHVRASLSVCVRHRFPGGPRPFSNVAIQNLSELFSRR